jgi:hypothetical protein
MRLSATAVIVVELVCAPARADNPVSDTAIKMGSREALVCYRQAEAATVGYIANRLHQFGPCIRNTDYGDETTPAEHIHTDMKHAAAYYLAVENFGRLTQQNYGTLGANEMRYLTESGRVALINLESRGYGPEQICALLSWIDCARFKALKRK